MPEDQPTEQAPQPVQVQPGQSALSRISIEMAPNGMVISTVTPIASLDENTMHQIVVKWLETHPALLAEIAKQAAEAKRNELQIIRHVKASRND